MGLWGGLWITWIFVISTFCVLYFLRSAWMTYKCWVSVGLVILENKVVPPLNCDIYGVCLLRYKFLGYRRGKGVPNYWFRDILCLNLDLICIFKQSGRNSEYWAKWNSIGFEMSGIGQNVPNGTEISHVVGWITDFQGLPLSNVRYHH